MDVTLIQQNIITDYYCREREKLIRFAAARLPFPEESEDVVQDTFLRLLEYGQMVQQESIASLVYTVLRNIINDKLRKFRCHQEVDRRLFEDAGSRSVQTTEHTINEHALLHIVEGKIQSLPVKWGKVYSLHLFDGLSVDEIVKRCGIPRRTVESYVFLARKAVRKEICEQWYSAV